MANAISWSGHCGDGNWHSCCFYGSVSFKANNWSYEPVQSPACPPYPGTDDDVDFSGHNVTLKDGNALVKSLTGTGVLTLGGGSFGKLTVANTAVLGGQLVFRDSGNFAGGLGKANAGMKLEAVISQAVSGGTLEVSGLTTWPGTGNLQLSGGCTLHNLSGSVFIARNSGSVTSGVDGGTLANQGEFYKTAGSGTLRIRSGVAFDNNGTTYVPSGQLSLEGTGLSQGMFDLSVGGTLVFPSGSHTLGTSSAVAGAGSVEVDGGQVFVQGSWPLTGLTKLISGTLSWDTPGGVSVQSIQHTGGICSGASLLTVTGTYDWFRGWMTGPGRTTIAPSGQLLLGGDYDKLLSAGRQLVNQSPASVWTGAGALSIYSDAVFRNESGATLELTSDAPVTVPEGQTAGTLENRGLLKKTGGAGTTVVNASFLSDGGALEVASGTLELAGDASLSGASAAQVAAAAGVRLTSNCEVESGSLTVSGDGTLWVASAEGELRVADGAAANVNLPGGGLVLDGGSLGWDGTVSSSGNALWQAGIIAGPEGLFNTGDLQIQGAGEKQLFGMLTNHGSVSQAGTDIVVGNMAGWQPTVHNAGGASYELQGDTGFAATIAPADGRIINAGSFSKTAGLGASEIGVEFENHGGDVLCASGVLRLAGGGTSTGGSWSVQNGGVIELAQEPHTMMGNHTGSGDGGLRLTSGSLSVPFGSVVDLSYAGTGFQVQGGMLDGNGKVKVTGTGGWSAGTISIAGGLETSGAFTVSGPAAKSLAKGVLSNSGQVTHTGAGAVALSQNGKIKNLAGAVWDLQSDSAFTGLDGEVTNAGTFRKSAGLGASSVGAPFKNTGAVEIRSGTLELAGGGTSTNGTFEWTDNAILRFGGEVFTFTGPHPMSGSGSAEITTSEVRLLAGSQFGAPGGLHVLLNGLLSGKGKVLSSLHNHTGEVSPGGDAIGHLEVAGDYAQGGDGTLTVRISGKEEASYDRLAVAGHASLAGTLQVDLGGFFAPSAGDQFVILTCGSRTGQFQSVRGSGPLGVTFAFDVAYSSNSVTLQVTGVTPPVLPLADARLLPDGWPVKLEGLVVSAVFGDFFYAQQPDRACGIRIQYTGGTLVRGQLVTATGRMGVNADGEKLLNADTVATAGTGPVVPLGMVCHRVGGAAFGYDPVSGAGQAAVGACPVGLNNVGLLVRVGGEVTAVDVSAGTLTVWDGSTCGATQAAVQVWAPGAVLPSVGQKVIATGASSCRREGGGLSAVIRVANPADITVP